MSIKTCKQHTKEPVFIYAACAGCEIQRYRYQEKALKAENLDLGVYWSKEVDKLKEEIGILRKALTDTREALGREYWDQYAGLDETRDILDAALK